jgi:hypothetical protein
MSAIDENNRVNLLGNGGAANYTCFNICHVFRCYLRFSLSKEHTVDPFMSVCCVFHHIVTIMTSEDIVPTM